MVLDEQRAGGGENAPGFGQKLESCITGEKDQRRLTWRLLSYWERLRGERDFPTLSDVKAEEIPELWPYCFILDVKNFREFPYFHYFGRSLARYSGVFLSGHQDLSHTLLKKAVCHYREAVERGAPVLVEEELTQFDRRRLLFRSVLLPLSEDQVSVDYLLGAANGAWSDGAGAAPALRVPPPGQD
ncbi:MAG: PAS domain-containing protein [Kiloniellales bacterium]|nr:PAS domain-containing protein [Kiloniellales bacterium]